MTDSDLAQIKNSLRQKSTEELISIWTENKRHKWPDEVFVVIKQMLVKRGVKVPRQELFEGPTDGVNYRKEAGTPFFPISARKLVIMSLCTFGVYEIYWFYRNWKFLREKYNFKVSPLGRAIFTVFFCHSLFKTIREYAQQNDVGCNYKPAQLSLAYILLTLCVRAPDPFWIISVLTFIPLLPAQKVINGLTNKLSSNSDIDSKFSGLNILAVVLGCIAWVLIILGMIYPG